MTNIFESKPQEVTVICLIFFSLSDLAYLPNLHPTSKLKTLDAENCAIETVHESFFRPGIMLNLKNNNISELPQKEVLQYMKMGGVFDNYESNSPSKPCIDFAFNPLLYPPNHVYDEGNSSIKNYLTSFLNSTVDFNDVTIMLIGEHASGEPSSLSLKEKLTSGKDLTLNDHPHAGLSVRSAGITIIDSNESLLAILSRYVGLHALILNPAHFDSASELDSIASPWIEKVLEGTISPHFQIIVSKMDTVPEDDKAKKKKLMIKMLENLVNIKMYFLKKVREKRETKLREELSEIDQKIPDLNSLRGLREKRRRIEAKTCDVKEHAFNQL